MLHLIPVIEFEPSGLGVQNFCELHETGAWPEHWVGVLAALGMRALRPGSWFVDTSEIVTPAALDVVLRVHLRWTGGSIASIPDEHDISPIPGGYAFVRDGEVDLEPGCCCDLSDLAQWKANFLLGSGPTQLLIGHALYSIASGEGVATITISSGVADQSDTHLSYSVEDFAVALKQAEQQQASFAESLAQRLRDLGAGTRSTRVAELLVYGEGD